MPTHHLRQLQTVPILLAALIACASLAAQAQSGYTMTVLSKPSSSDATHYMPFQLDNLGVVRGVALYKVGSAPGTTWFSPRLTTYSPQPATWANGTGTSVTPSLGAKKYYPVFSNQQGTLVGTYRETAGASPAFVPLHHEVFLQIDPSVGVRTVRQGMVETPFPAGSNFLPKAINNANLMVGSNRSASNAILPATLLNGALTILDQGDFDVANPLAVNDNGTIVGSALKQVSGTSVQTAVTWVNGRITALDLPDSLGTSTSSAVSVNNAGQILFWAAQQGFGIWFNGSVTRLDLGPVVANAGWYNLSGLSDSGTVVGCAVLGGTQTWPFLWKNGSTIDLVKDLAAKGIAPPKGYSFGCPVAINKAGSILTYYWKGTGTGDSTKADSSVVWVRLNAKP